MLIKVSHHVVLFIPSLIHPLAKSGLVMDRDIFDQEAANVDVDFFGLLVEEEDVAHGINVLGVVASLDSRVAYR